MILLFRAIASVVLAAQVPASAPRPRVEIAVDPRTELVTILMRLAGAEEYQRAAESPYLKAAEKQFRPFAGHAAVAAAQQLRAKRGIAFDAAPSLAVHLDPKTLAPRMPLDPWPARLDVRWKGSVDAFLPLLKSFAADSKFDDFFQSQRPFYERVENAYKKAAADVDPVPWFDGFFGARAGARFLLAPSPLQGPNNFGLAAGGPGDSDVMVQCIGITSFDAAGDPIVPRGFGPLYVHELAHSYCNPLVDQYLSDLADAGAKLFESQKDVMRGQAYAEARTVLCESFVRAVCCLFEEERHGADAGVQQTIYELTRGFVWTRGITDALRDIRKERVKGVPIDGAMHLLIDAFRKAAAAPSAGADAYFLGPVNGAYLSPALQKSTVCVIPETLPAPATKHVRQIFDQLFAKRGGASSAPDKLADPEKHPLILYGDPQTNALLKRVADDAGWTFDASGIRLGDVTFSGGSLMLIACWPNPWNRKLPAVVYAANDLTLLAGAHAVFHGDDDWLVARRAAGGKLEVVDRGNFPKDYAGNWRSPKAKK